MRYGMIIDLNRCYGCHACAIACKQKNATPPEVFWTRVYTKEVGVYPNMRREFTPSLCMHCKKPVCVEVCMYGATVQRADGIVTINQNRCVACLQCVAACPYNARFFDFNKKKSYYPGKAQTDYEKANELTLRSGAVSKCTLCVDRLENPDENYIPACVQVCPTEARIFGDLDETEMQQKIIKGGGYQDKVERGTDPSIYYLPIKP